MIELKSTPAGVILPLHVQPKASNDKVVGEHGGMLKVAVSAAPERGKANQAVIKLLVHTLHIRKSQLSLVAGETSRDKTVLITGLTRAQLLDKLKPFTSSS